MITYSYLLAKPTVIRDISKTWYFNVIMYYCEFYFCSKFCTTRVFFLYSFIFLFESMLIRFYLRYRSLVFNHIICMYHLHCGWKVTKYEPVILFMTAFEHEGSWKRNRDTGHCLLVLKFLDSKTSIASVFLHMFNTNIISWRIL